MKHHGKIHTGIIFVMLFLSVSPAQVKKGQVGFRFLENPVAAEAIGRGGLGQVLTANANTVFWNPAGLGWIVDRYDLNLNYTNGIADINHSSVAGSFRLFNFAVIGIDMIIMDYGDFYGTRRADNEQGFIDTGTFSPQAYAIGLTFSQKITDRFSYGVRMKFANQDLGSAWISTAGTDVEDPNLQIKKKAYRNGILAMDVGAIYDFQFRSIRFGAVIQNVSKELKYEDEKFPLPFAAGFSLLADPIALIAGDEQKSPLVIGFETRHPRDFKEKYNWGVEYNYQEILLLRAGYMINYDERGLTFGIGARKDILNMHVRLDYAFEDFGLFGGVHTFSFGMSY